MFGSADFGRVRFELCGLLEGAPRGVVVAAVQLHCFRSEELIDLAVSFGAVVNVFAQTVESAKKRQNGRDVAHPLEGALKFPVFAFFRHAKSRRTLASLSQSTYEIQRRENATKPGGYQPFCWRSVVTCAV